MRKSGLHITKDRLVEIVKALTVAQKSDVLVGVPREDAERKPDDDEQGPMNNASLAYIHDRGDPASGIPNRPFMKPGITNALEPITKYFNQAAQALFDGDESKAERCYEAAGVTAVSSIRKVIQAGIAPALADSTLKARARRAGKRTGVSIAKGAKAELASRAEGNVPGLTTAKPLIDTGQMLKAISFVVRKGKQAKPVNIKSEKVDK